MTKSIRSRFIVSFLLLSQMAFAGALRKQEADSLISSDHSKTWSLPAAADTLLGRTSTDTLTNKSLSGSSNTFTNIPAGSALSGQVPIANGGTNLSSYAAGQLIYASATNVLTQLSVGSSGQVLQSVGGFPAWGTTQGNWTAYTVSNSSWGNSVVTYSALYKRTGDSISIRLSMYFSGAPSGVLTFSQSQLFGTLSLTVADSSLPEQPGSPTNKISIGTWTGYKAGANIFGGISMYDTEGGANDFNFFNNSNNTVTATNPWTIASGDSLTINIIELPITGWN